MTQYKLYKGAWVSIEENKEQMLTTEEAKLLLSKGGLFVRNVFDFDRPSTDDKGFWFVIKDTFGGLEELTSSTRRDVRKGLRIYNIHQITVNELQTVGYDIFRLAQESYRVKCNAFTREEFEALIDEYEQSGNKEYWAVEHKETGEVVALGLNTIKEDSCEYNVLKCKPHALRNGSQPYYALIYEMNRHYLEERGLKYVNDGARSMTNHSNIQPFLMQKFKFRRAYCGLKLHYKWWLAIIVKVLYPFRQVIPVKKVKMMLDMYAMSKGVM